MTHETVLLPAYTGSAGDDILIATYARLETTPVKRIVDLLLHEAAQPGRRAVETHLPANEAGLASRIIYVGRDGRDVVRGAYRHILRADEQLCTLLGRAPGPTAPLPRPQMTPRDHFLEWLERDGHPLSSFWEHSRSWWALRDRPNVLLLHVAELEADLPDSIRRIAAFLSLAPSEEGLQGVAERCAAATSGEVPTRRDELTAADNWRYMHAARAELGSDCTRWLVTGERAPALQPSVG